MGASGSVGEVGARCCVELIEQLRTEPGVHGVHILAVAWEDMALRAARNPA